MNQDIEAVARTLYGEARGEGYQGMVAVANVIMNRVKLQSWYGLTPYEVCHKLWQFSCWNKDDPNLKIIEDVTPADPIFKECLNIAYQAVEGTLEDITGGAVNYFSRSMKEPPAWAEGQTPTAAIGHQLFYKLA